MRFRPLSKTTKKILFDDIYKIINYFVCACAFSKLGKCKDYQTFVNTYILKIYLDTEIFCLWIFNPKKSFLQIFQSSYLPIATIFIPSILSIV